MELETLKAQMAASIIGGVVASDSTKPIEDREIAAAVRIAQRIWEEVLRQERE
jgi:hypothetical protein